MEKVEANYVVVLNAVMSGKTEEQQYLTFLFVIDERGREIFNTFTWNRKTRVALKLKRIILR